MENHKAWLHGLYVYDAVTSAMSMMSQNKQSHRSYATKPYSFSKEDREEKKEAEVIEAQAQAEVWLKSWAAATQKMFDKK